MKLNKIIIEIHQLIKFNSLATSDDPVKDEESVIEEQVAEHENHEQEHLDEEVTEQVEEEMALETPDAEDDILISTEEIVEDVVVDKEVLEPSDAMTQEQEADEDDTSNADAGVSVFEADIPSEIVQEECDSKISTEDVVKKELDEVEKDPQASPVYTPVEANIEVSASNAFRIVCITQVLFETGAKNTRFRRYGTERGHGKCRSKIDRPSEERGRMFGANCCQRF